VTRGAHAPAVVVVGAGSAGATVAWKLAAADHRVVLIDRAAREALGRPWINGVEERLFPDLGIRARPPIRFAERQRVIMQTPAGHRMSIEQPPVAEIDMRHLTDALLRNALLFGVRLRCRSEVRRLIVEGGAVHGVVVRGPEGGEENIAARCVVHAAGHRRIPGTEELGDQAPGGTIEEADLCVAHQQVHRIDDLEEARRFMTRQRLGPHDTLCRVGGRGGYSIANIGIDPAARRVSFLTGAMMTQGSGAAREMLQELRAELPFAGPVLLGGGGTIPVRRPHASLVAKGLALVGDAAAQVYPAHGSGVAAGVRAALLLARTLDDALRAGGAIDEPVLWPYAALFMRSRGALCAGSEIMRKLSESLTAQEIDRLFGDGLARPEINAAVMACLPFRPSPLRLPALLGRLLAAGALGRKVGRAVLRAAAQERHHRRYPARFDRRELERWEDRADALALLP